MMWKLLTVDWVIPKLSIRPLPHSSSSNCSSFSVLLLLMTLKETMRSVPWIHILWAWVVSLPLTTVTHVLSCCALHGGKTALQNVQKTNGFLPPKPPFCSVIEQLPPRTAHWTALIHCWWLRILTHSFVLKYHVLSSKSHLAFSHSSIPSIKDLKPYQDTWIFRSKAFCKYFRKNATKEITATGFSQMYSNSPK